MTASGLDLSALDTSIRPQDDLFGHVNGTWLASHAIPADRAADGSMYQLRDRAEADVREIVERCAAGDVGGASARQVGDLYASFMDTERIEELGLDALEPVLRPVREAATHEDLAALMGAADAAQGLFAPYVWTDAKNSDRIIVQLAQAGLGLPDEAYYREDRYAELRTAYREHLAAMAALAGLAEGDAATDLASRVYGFEESLARHHVDVVASRDQEARYNLRTLTQVQELAPSFPWDRWLDATGQDRAVFAEVNVTVPDYVRAAADVFRATALDTVRDWFAVHQIMHYAPYLHAALVDAEFAFSGRVLSGIEELRERWKRGLSLVETFLGEAVGELFVAEHFPPHAKERMDVLVDDLVAAYRRSIAELDWMGEDTRGRALAKLERFTPKIGYPVRWKDYSELVIDRTDLIGNVLRGQAHRAAFEFGKVLRPVDRDEWFMTPQTVNAYYNPGMNEIVFPAAILRPPFFDAEADAAANYGGIGAVIGHEIGHGFDDQGSKFDGDGNMVSWWTDDDRREFEQRTTALIGQYDAFSPRDLTDADRVNGAFTIGENIGDLGGLSIALEAYRIAAARDGLDLDAEIDGLTGLQRVFFAWAQVWRGKTRPEAARMRLATDPHSPAEFRCNGVVRNLDEFHEAFAVAADDALWLAPEDRVTIW